ncbi:choice-of-anchor tandem repeat GloVer-containing protein [Roseivirga sp.]|uniref:choice-of-anchor tandem repeat GloVer-containing protein n=1 Tax=Roseivirga sp. TaxID=1964215 RepID=UPI003B8DAB55
MSRLPLKFFLGFLLLYQIGFAQNTQLWSVTSNNGAHGYGTIFYIDNDGSDFTKVHDFDGVHGYPFASLTKTKEKLWGMVMGRTGSPSSPESAGHGAIFNLNADGSNFKYVHAFNGVNGSMPLGELIEHEGRLWGMTNMGGKYGQGVIFSIGLDGADYQKVHDFTEQEGGRPRNSLLINGDKFWGTTWRGGKNGMGVIFSLNHDGSGYSKVYDFESRRGGEPESGLTLYKNKFYGMTARGGRHNEGTVFSMNLDGTEFEKIHDFIYPTLGDLILSNGKLWGMMALRGEYNAGVIFTIDATIYQEVHHFDKENGRFPEGNLMENEGILWGMTRFGGKSNLGVIFSIGKDGKNFKKVYDFDQASGGVPYGSFIAFRNKQ